MQFNHRRAPHPEIEAAVSRVHPDSEVRFSRADSCLCRRYIITIRFADEDNNEDEGGLDGTRPRGRRPRWE
jgi:hypothetical protein